MNCLPDFELKASSASETSSLGEWTHEWRGRAGGTKLVRAAAWQLCAAEPAVCLEAGGSRLCQARGRTPSALLRQGEMGPFCRGIKSVLGTASGVYNTLNYR